MAEESMSEVTTPVRQVLLISAGASHSVALLSGNIVCSWGRGEDGQLGHGDAHDRLLPTQLSSLDEHEIVSVTCGADHTTAYSLSRVEVYSWGWGDFGRLGHGNSSDLFTPQPIKALHGLKIKQIACGDSHCLAVTMDGEVQSINYEVEKFYSKGNFSIWHRKFLHKVFLRKVGKLENMSDKYWEEMEEKAASEILLNLDDEFWLDRWCGTSSLLSAIPIYIGLAVAKRQVWRILCDSPTESSIGSFSFEGRCIIVNWKLSGASSTPFIALLIWKQKIPSRVAFFAWSAALGKCLTIDNLRKRKVCILDWCYMCKRSSESVDHLFLHCPVASELWDMVFGLFGVCWIMPSSVVGLFACWQGHFGHLRNGVIWKVVPLCLMWCIWKERNSRCFEDSERAMPDLKLLFIRTLLECWGRNQNGQLGLGTTEDSLVPQKIQAFQGVSIKMVAAGAEHTAAVTEDGELYGWGWGRYGNLGLGDRNDRLVPEKVSAVDGVKMVTVACGWRHTISVSASGGLYTYGWSKYGQLGHGDFKDHLIPHKLEALHDNHISQISGGWRHTMAITSDGKLYGWGWNKFGQVGAGDNEDHCSPVQVKFPHEQKVVQISCGWRHSLAVTEKQNVFSWGRGTNGQLGHGESVDRNIPKIIESLSVDGSSGQQIESSNVDPSSGKTWVSLSERYAVVPDETVQGQASVSVSGNGNDASVPEN
uniref:Ultraviolet-B receptor UVR8 n=1 Tax=Quercus lobata TaxID=97700 RepID=A0A7N2MU36_QUELO